MVDGSTFLEDAKEIYGSIQDQVSSAAILTNLMADGTKFGQPIHEAGLKGYSFLARLRPNWNLGFRPEGVTGVGAAGHQGLKQAKVYLKYAYVPEAVTGQAQNLTKDQAKAFMQAKALETKFDMTDITSHVNVIVAAADRGGQLGVVAANPAPAQNAFSLVATAGTLKALYLRVGQKIDTAAVGGGALTLNNAELSTIDYPNSAVTHTGGGTAVAGEAVHLHGEIPVDPNDFPYTCEGLASLVSDTGEIQGLNPATAGQETWKSTVIDGNGAISASLLQQLRQFVKNRGGADVDVYLTPSAQIAALVELATTTLRFDVGTVGAVGKKALDLGFSVFTYAGKDMVEDKDLRPDSVYAGKAEMMAKFEAIPLSLAEDEASTWTRITGADGIADAVAALLRWYLNVGTKQRSAWGVLNGLDIPAAFATAPPTY